MGLFDNLKRNVEQSAKNAVNRGVRQGVSNAVNGAVHNAVNSAKNAGTTKTREITLSRLPMSLAELQAMPEAALTDPFVTAALVPAVLNVFGTNREECCRMMDFLNGPADLSGMDQQFMRDQSMDGRDYVARSYFKGATPDNNYTPSQPYTVTVMQNSYSQNGENYLQLWLYSGGADHPREVQLRQKPSTGQWFAVGWRGLLAGIRVPKADDPWA